MRYKRNMCAYFINSPREQCFSNSQRHNSVGKLNKPPVLVTIFNLCRIYNISNVERHAVLWFLPSFHSNSNKSYPTCNSNCPKSPNFNFQFFKQKKIINEKLLNEEKQKFWFFFLLLDWVWGLLKKSSQAEEVVFSSTKSNRARPEGDGNLGRNCIFIKHRVASVPITIASDWPRWHDTLGRVSDSVYMDGWGWSPKLRATFCQFGKT